MRQKIERTLDNLKSCTATTANGCWQWTRSTQGNGYGTVRYGTGMKRAHRVAWILVHGPIPAGMCVLHRCDNPPCINPDHLRLGTQAENLCDMFRKKRQRQARGETFRRSKLNEEKVRTILKSPKNYAELGREFGVSKVTIRQVRLRKTWAHVQVTEAHT